jgi:hypothetical protein
LEKSEEDRNVESIGAFGVCWSGAASFQITVMIALFVDRWCVWKILKRIGR